MAKKRKRGYKKGKAYKPAVKSKEIKTKYTGPTPRQNMAMSVRRQKKAEEMNDDDGSNERRVNRQEKRQRVIRMY